MDTPRRLKCIRELPHDCERARKWSRTNSRSDGQERGRPRYVFPPLFSFIYYSKYCFSVVMTLNTSKRLEHGIRTQEIRSRRRDGTTRAVGCDSRGGVVR